MLFLKKHNEKAVLMRNFMFGVEDSLVSTVGLVSGIAAAGVGQKEIILTGTILVFVEAFSMGVGSLLSEQSAEEYESKREVPMKNSLDAGTIMFFSYLVSGFIPIFPYIFFPTSAGIMLSVALTLASLFLLGAGGAKISKTRPFRHGTEMLILGGIAIAVGVAVGQFIKIF